MRTARTLEDGNHLGLILGQKKKTWMIDKTRGPQESRLPKLKTDLAEIPSTQFPWYKLFLIGLFSSGHDPLGIVDTGLEEHGFALAMHQMWFKCTPRDSHFESLVPSVVMLRAGGTFKRWGLVQGNRSWEPALAGFRVVPVDAR